jgi:HAD superfamily hydrolase (TIGR01509 family)
MVIFDLDQTLIDSRVTEALRRSRRWPEVYRLIPKYRLYDGIYALLAELQANAISTAIVTSSPRTYCEAVIRHWKLPVQTVVAYHDTRRHKPFPDPILRALELGKVSANDAIHIGDTIADTEAAAAAGVYSVGALWGAGDRDALKKSQPDRCCEVTSELRDILASRYTFFGSCPGMTIR